MKVTGGKLNDFQRTMLLWEEVGPYNGTHALRLAGPLDVAALREAIGAACGAAGIGDLVLDPGRGLFRYDPPAEPIPLRVIEPTGSSPRTALIAAAAAEMDRPFPCAPHHPIRWLAAADPAAGDHYLALVYHHVAADATSIRLLLADILARYAASDAPPQTPAGAPGGTPRTPGLLRGAGALARSARLYFRLRHAYRMPLRRGVETSTASRFLVRTPLAGLLDRVAAAARARGGTVNDAFLAALARSLAEMTPRRRGHRRSALAIALVADRRGAEDPEARAFGVQLGQSVVLVEDPDAGAPGDLLARVAASTRGIKATGALAGPQWNFTLLSRLARRFPSWNTRAWYRKVYPLAGGLTNVRWRPEAFGPGGARIGEYFRLPPPGPVLPLVVAPTTFGETLTVAMGYNESSLDEPAAERLLDLFLRNLDALG